MKWSYISELYVQWWWQRKSDLFFQVEAKSHHNQNLFCHVAAWHSGLFPAPVGGEIASSTVTCSCACMVEWHWRMADLKNIMWCNIYFWYWGKFFGSLSVFRRNKWKWCTEPNHSWDNISFKTSWRGDKAEMSTAIFKQLRSGMKPWYSICWLPNRTWLKPALHCIFIFNGRIVEWQHYFLI